MQASTVALSTVGTVRAAKPVGDDVRTGRTTPTSPYRPTIKATMLNRHSISTPKSTRMRWYRSRQISR